MRFLAFAFRPGTPPDAIKLWNIGANPTDYGVHKWTDRSVREVLAVYEARGNPLQIDVEHNAADAPRSDKPTGGYARLELREREPWLVFDWSAFAVEQIATRQRLFLSPEYDVDKTTGEIVRLVRVSLVGDPGTHHARMLASAARVTTGAGPMNLALILAALRAALAAEDPEVAKTQMAALIAEIEKAAGGASEGEPPASEEAAAEDPPPAPEKETQQASGEAAPPPAEEDKREPVAASAKKPVPAKAVPTVAVDVANQAALALAKVAVLEAQNRVLAHASRIPEGLRSFAAMLDEAQFARFVEGLPELPASEQTTGIRASTKVTKGSDPNRPSGQMPAEDASAMARIFASENRPTESVSTLPDGRVRATHIYRPAAGEGK